MPKVSVITPCYNAASYIQSTIDSVRSQDMSDWEHIVVDDGSSDESARIVESAAEVDERIVLIRQSNRGVHTARRTGAEHAEQSSAYLVFLDADDVLEPSFLRTLGDHLDGNPKVGLVYCSYLRVDASGAPLPIRDAVLPRYVPRGLRIRAAR